MGEILKYDKLSGNLPPERNGSTIGGVSKDDCLMDKYWLIEKGKFGIGFINDIRSSSHAERLFDNHIVLPGKYAYLGLAEVGLVAITGNSTPMDRAEVVALGRDWIVPKPFVGWDSLIFESEVSWDAEIGCWVVNGLVTNQNDQILAKGHLRMKFKRSIN